VSYDPRPGTVAWKALQHLETLPAGAEILGSKLAEAIGAEAYQIQPCMLSLIAANMAYRRQKDDHPRSPWWYSLTDYSQIPRAPVQRVVVPDGVDIDAAHEHTPKGANRAASAGQSHGAAGSESPNGRGTDGAPALGAAPVSSTAEALVDVAMVLRVTPRQAEAFARLAREGAWA
jgi:hypothetical protein